jgi:lysophospholipase L1-like esterase
MRRNPFQSSRASLMTLVLMLFCLVISPAFAQAQTPLKDGDRVVIYGDSITQQMLYSRYMQQYVDCRYPDKKIVFINAGWSGDRAPGGLNRLKRDVLTHKPTVVTLFFGMNDGSYREVNDGIVTTYRKGMEGIIKALQAENVRVVVYTPGCVDYDRRANLKACDYNKNLEALGNACKELAAQYNCDFVDVFHPMLDFMTKQKQANDKFTMIPDAVHPSPEGHMVMARHMLTAFAEPMPPLGVVDVASGSAEGLTLVSKSDSQVELKGTPNQFPFWISEAILPIAQACGMVDFATPKLTVKGLADGVYDVLVGGDVILSGTNAKALAEGVSIVLPTTTGKILHDLIESKERSYFNTWRNVRLQINDAEYRDQIVAPLMEVDDAFHKAIWALTSKSPEVSISIVAKPEGGNLALNCKYEVSNPNNYNWGIGGLTDGSWSATSKTCFASGDAAAFPKDATIDLGKLATINSVQIGVPGFGSTKTVKISVSKDKSEFTEVGEYVFSQRKEERHTFAFAPTTARFVRLTYVDKYEANVGYSPNFAFTTECEVYGKPVE